MKIKLKIVESKEVDHKHLTRGLKFCPICGEKTEVVSSIKVEYTCSKCRHLVLVTDSFCGFCGANVEGEEKSAEHYMNGEKLSEAKFIGIEKSILGGK
jgi:hypothetical protein